MCCLKYEHPLYQDFAEKAPAVGEQVETPDGDGHGRRAQRPGREGRRADGRRRPAHRLRARVGVLEPQGVRVARARADSRRNAFYGGRMPTRDSALAAGTPCWIDLMTTDVEAARATSTVTCSAGSSRSAARDRRTTRLRLVDGRRVAGIFQMQVDHPPVWTTYLATDDADATATSVTEHGGTIVAADDGRDGPRPDDDRAGSDRRHVRHLAGGHALRHRSSSTRPNTLTWNEFMTRDYDARQDVLRGRVRLHLHRDRRRRLPLLDDRGRRQHRRRARPAAGGRAGRGAAALARLLRRSTTPTKPWRRWSRSAPRCVQPRRRTCRTAGTPTWSIRRVRCFSVIKPAPARQNGPSAPVRLIRCAASQAGAPP